MTAYLAYNLFFSRAFDFEGRTARREFWLGVLPNAVIMTGLIALLVVGLVAFETAINPLSIVMLILSALFCLIELLPSAALIIRRMHDIGKDGKYICVLLIPVFGFIYYLYLVTRPTDFYAPFADRS